MAVKTAALTVNVVLPLTAPMAAEMTLVPAPTPLTRPTEPAALDTVAFVGAAAVQVAVIVTSCVEASLKNPVATNCCLLPWAIVGSAGVTAIDTSVAFETVSVVLPVTAPTVADTTEVPFATPLASPADPPAFEIVAVVGVTDDQVAVAVRFCVVASL
ncbi:MAG TPA: hypothetical protein VH560_18830 [Polyangia bacterium]|nr:hypothetical protein [Polyangia bacterium]